MSTADDGGAPRGGDGALRRDPEPLAGGLDPAALRRVALVAADPALGDGLDLAARAGAQRDVRVGALTVRPGPWRPPAERPDGAVGLLVADGFALRQVELAGRRQALLVGPGDLVDPWSAPADDLRPGVPAQWRVIRPTVLALLDAGAVAAAQAHAPLALALARRLVERGEQLSALVALIQLPRIDLRLIAVMWHFAQRWGRMGPDGFVLELPVTHEVLGQLVGARRPSVTLALGTLDAAALLRRRPATGAWVLHRDTGSILRGDGAALDEVYAVRGVDARGRGD